MDFAGRGIPIGCSMPLHERSSRRVVVQLMIVDVKKSKPKGSGAEFSFCGRCGTLRRLVLTGLCRLLLAARPHLNMYSVCLSNPRVL